MGEKIKATSLPHSTLPVMKADEAADIIKYQMGGDALRRHEEYLLTLPDSEPNVRKRQIEEEAKRKMQQDIDYRMKNHERVARQRTLARAAVLRKMIDGDMNVEAQQAYIQGVIDDFKNKPDSRESRYIHDDHKDINTYEYDELVQPRSGLEAKQHFWKVNKDQKHVLNQLTAANEQVKAPSLGYLSTIAHAPVYPRVNGFDFSKNRELINLKSQSLSPQAGYLPSIIKGVKLSSNIKHLILSKTNLNTQGCILIVKSIGPQIQTLDISNNPEIQMPAYKLLCELLESEDYK